MRKKTIAKRPPREKVYKLPTKPSTRSQDRTFTPSPSPPNSPPRTDPMARTKTTPRYPASAKPTPPPKAPSSKPGSSKPSSSKGKRPVAEEPIPEPTQPKSRSVPVCSQRGKPHPPLKSVREPDIDPFAHKSHFMTSHSNYNPYRFRSAMYNNFFEGVVKAVHSYVKGQDIVLNNETVSDALKYTDIGPCAYTSVKLDEGVGISYNDDFISQSNHMIAMSKEQRKLASKHENFLQKSRDRVAVFMTFIDNLQKDEDPATDADEEVDSEGNSSDA
nr:anther-specific proline-rich protein APG-like [Arachis hypogaea]